MHGIKFYQQLLKVVEDNKLLKCLGKWELLKGNELAQSEYHYCNKIPLCTKNTLLA